MRSAPRNRRKFPISGAIVAAVWLMFVAWQYSNTGVTFPAVVIGFYGGLLWGGVWLVRLIVWSVRFKRMERLGLPVAPRGFLFWAVEPVAGTLSVFLILTGALPAARFHLSKSALDACVRQVWEGALPAPGRLHRPQRVGLYVVTEVEHLTNNVIRLITSPDGLNDAGLAYSPASEPPTIGEDSYHPATGGWWYWHRSW